MIVWIGCSSVILKGVTIGEGAIVGAGSVVTTSIPPWTVCGGTRRELYASLRPKSISNSESWEEAVDWLRNQTRAELEQ